MPNDIQKLYQLPDISFIDNVNVNTVLEEMISDYQNKYYELTGEYETVGEFDKSRILMNAAALKLYQAYQYIEKSGKMNLLKYATGDYLDNLGASRGVTRNEEKAAVCIVKFSLSQAQNNVIAIPVGTLITSGDGVYFATDEYAEIPIGTECVEVPVTCQVAGSIGNSYAIGQLNILTEPIPYISEVSNTTNTSGGEDAQSDEDFREKIFLAPSGYSTAGPEDAYIYHAKVYSSLISDIKLLTPSADTVQLVVLKKNGEIPDAEFLENLQVYLSDNNIKPMTEYVTVIAPTVVRYNISGKYYINRSDKDNVTLIMEAVTSAIEEYISWQKNKIGRDLNPFHLQYLLMKAGIKRTELTAPNYMDIADTSVAIADMKSLVYGGIEDD